MVFNLWLISAVLILIVLLAIIFVLIRAKHPKKRFNGKYPEGHFLGLGMASFMGVGVALGLVLDNLSLGIAIGLPIGLAIGYVWEEKAKKRGNIRPLTKEERARKVLVLKLVLGLGLLLFLLFATTFFFLKG